MKRKASFGFILLFLLYLGCKSSLFGVCLSPDAFVKVTKVPPCHQTQSEGTSNKETCDCPIVFDSLQSPTDLVTSFKKPSISLVSIYPSSPWKGFVSSVRKIQMGFVYRETRLPTHLPTRTIRLLI
ncbi:hypothetical protein EHQ62_14160 [Leptospira jelokensis]|uniref:Uncharacterized protein n=1 Tax=Leptospira jelokensis TaxID=2484931 RepID=A0A4Z0ZYZ2_9LEPT|nr:hypothetical protein EHQ62_14160 [Leptospira jelokensis]